ncbi:DUF2235 domain-containing protein [uncultured Litoreibacter sp.]|uniref:T6SS phospholipase effector Tle1-like catalytic domain-containing protein n=1 Tax=uncultured Litoreibacter sp. TaxID=1392394 RepID=UPI0026261801|nr:DUF2235 domain-containing protein [uncultured Litoreibacter sp.]
MAGMSSAAIESGAAADMEEIGSAHAGGVVQSCPKVTLEIGVFFDGTGNNEKNAETGGEGSYSNARSNVSLLKDLYWNEPRHDTKTSCDTWETRHRSLYVQGIGTETGEEDDIWGSAMGIGERGVENRVIEAALDVGEMINRLSPGVEPKEVILDVFGFSRGAAAARHFVNGFNAGRLDYQRVGMIDLIPLLGWINDKHATLPKDRNIRIRFLGIFDTVAAIAGDLTADNGDVDVHLKAASADTIYHLTAEDEIRHSFSLNDNQPGGGEVERLAGVHSNVGGGYPKNFKERPVIKLPTTGMSMSRAQAEAAQVAAVARLRATMLADAAVFISEGWITAADLPDAWELEKTAIEIEVVAYGPAVQTYYKWSVLTRMNRPWIRHELSRLAMKKMYDKAKSSGVPMKDYPDSGEYAIPEDLSSASPAVIKRDFTHHSANYNDIYPVIGAPMRERAGRVRKVHPNQTGRAK